MLENVVHAPTHGRHPRSLCSEYGASSYKNYIYAMLLEESPHPFPPNTTRNDGG